MERHDVDWHILPQLGNFISFIQSAGTDERRQVRDLLYEELRRHRSVFDRIRKEPGKEVLELLDDSLDDIQILLVIDRMTPELSLGLSQIEKAIKVKIRKIELRQFVRTEDDRIVLFTDSEQAGEERVEDGDEGGYTVDYHLEGLPSERAAVVRDFESYARKKGFTVQPQKHYIGFHNKKGMLFSCVPRRKSILFYSKATHREIRARGIPLRDVRHIGHYTNHLPTEIAITEKSQIGMLKGYFDKVIAKFK